MSSDSNLSRRAFLYVSGMAASALSYAKDLTVGPNSLEHKYAKWDRLLSQANAFSFTNTLFGRRSRRFGWGMEIPKGPFAYKSNQPPSPLDDFEKSFLIAAGLGVSGWHHGIPYSDAQDGLCDYSARYTGRTLPTAAGIGNTDMFYTDDTGTYLVSTRDAVDDGNWFKQEMRDSRRLIESVARHTHRLSEDRIVLPRESPHYSPHNLWNANVPGSTLFIPVGNVSEQLIAFLFIASNAGFTVWDDLRGAPAGELNPFFESGLLDRDKKYPLRYMEQYMYSTSAVEMGVIGHNISLALQPLGLGGWFFSGVSPFSLMGVAASKGIEGLGFQFEHNPDWGVPNPVGLKGLYEGYCPPFYPDMKSAVQAYVDLKFGDGGTYDPQQSGPFIDGEIKKAVARPSQELIDCVVTIADYIYQSFGKFPGTVPTILIRYYTQAHRLDTRFYDKFFKRNYLTTHQQNVDRWS